MGTEVSSHGLFTGYHGQTARKLLRHKKTSLLQFVFIGLSRKVLGDQLSSRNASNGHRAFYSRHDNLS